VDGALLDPDRVMITVALVDDDHLVRSGVRMILESTDDIVVTAEAADGRSGISAVARARPDLALVDIRMPQVDDIEATEIISRESPGTRVVVLTTFERDEYVFDALRAGASGFLLKRTPPEELIAAIRVVAAGEALLSPSVTRRLIQAFVQTPTTRRASAELDSLTGREREVLVAMATGASNAELATRLFVSEETIRTHVKRVLHKLGLRDRAQAVVFAYESGVVTPGST
jgi:DNA-binding NarL/FixJ family response regulator